MRALATQVTPVESAQEAGLRFVTDDRPGITRRPVRHGFRYFTPQGRDLKDRQQLARIRSLAVPPAWRDVWICPDPRGHVQATGRDARGRKQHRYHPRWREARDETKYERMLAFGAGLPTLRRRIDRDLARRGLPREKVLAAVARLLEKTLIRVGNEEYARTNHSYGLTTLRDRHVTISGASLKFRFRGKSGIQHSVEFSSPRLARIVKRCQDLPGQELFQYVDREGHVQNITSTDVNDYLRKAMGDAFTAKDFRTWTGTVLAAQALHELKAFTSQAHAKRNLMRAIEVVAKLLGNTKTVCRKCYIHPALVDAYMDGTLTKLLSARPASTSAERGSGLGRAEVAVLALLQRRLNDRGPRRRRATARSTHAGFTASLRAVAAERSRRRPARRSRAR